MPRLGLGLGLGSLIGRPSIGGGSVAPFSPDQLAGLIEWFEPETGVYSIVGNYFTDENRTIQLASFPVLISYLTNNPNGTLQVNGTLNNKNFYTKPSTSPEYNGRYPVEVFWDEANTRWTLYYQAQTNDSGESFNSQERYGVGDTEYPWQATWADGTVQATPTTVDTLAQTNDYVQRWTNKVTGQPNAEQTSENLQPQYREENGKKFLFFNGWVLTMSRSPGQAPNPPLTYYAVATFGTYLINRAINTISARNALLGNGGNLALRASITRTSTLNVNVGEALVCGVFEGNGNGLVGRKNRFDTYEEQALFSLGTVIATSTTSCLGAGATNGGSSIGRIYEFLAYNQAHGPEDRLKVVNYLQQKYSI